MCLMCNNTLRHLHEHILMLLPFLMRRYRQKSGGNLKAIVASRAFAGFSLSSFTEVKIDRLDKLAFNQTHGRHLKLLVPYLRRIWFS